MVELKLNNKEKVLLKETLERSLSQLHDEISHTDSIEYRDMLKKRESSLLKIRGLLH